MAEKLSLVDMIGRCNWLILYIDEFFSSIAVTGESVLQVFRACPNSPDFLRWHFRKCHEVLVRYLESPGEDLTGKVRI